MAFLSPPGHLRINTSPKRLHPPLDLDLFEHVDLIQFLHEISCSPIVPRLSELWCVNKGETGCAAWCVSVCVRASRSHQSYAASVPRIRNPARRRERHKILRRIPPPKHYIHIHEVIQRCAYTLTPPILTSKLLSAPASSPGPVCWPRLESSVLTP